MKRNQTRFVVNNAGIDQEAIIQNVAEVMRQLSGSTAQRFMKSGLNVNALRPYTDDDGRAYVTLNGKRDPVANALLRKDEWKYLDEALRRIARDRLAAVDDLRAAGLVVNNGGLGTMLHQYEKVTDMDDASVSMGIDVPPQKDDIGFTLASVPVPIFSKAFRLDLRRLEASRRRGEGLDTTGVESATRKVVEKIETMVFNGLSAINVSGDTIYGYRNHANRITGTGTGDWGTVAHVDATIIKAIAALEAKNHFGPYVVYLHGTQYAEMRAAIDSTNQITAYERVMKRPEIRAIRPSMKMTAGEMVMVQMTSDVVQLSVGQDITLVEWRELGGLVFEYLVMAAMAIVIKPDASATPQLGVLHYTGI
ncbi:MAG: family 1 encapsulin nanocompartment shell protein [Candidatus Krumholzibacteria bacterium]|nr:family 1 encapsulin nanocompartment shell protein [Candidatus Krumholzibacteria bacterium]